MVLRDGLERATVRAVAAEAELSLGAISHYFSSQEELQLYALRLVDEQDEARMAAISHEGSARAVVERYLWALIPMDEESRERNQIFYAFMARAQVVPAFREITEEINTDVVALCRSAIELLDREGMVDPGHDRDVLVSEFRAMTEGLSFQGVMWPESTTPDVIRAVIGRWLDSLAVAPTR